jgi:3-oxoacyl-[acyl-carrier protein] reductase
MTQVENAKVNPGLTFSVPEGGVALVTGGGRGIGRAIALRLAGVGYDIWLNYHSNDAAAAEVEQQITRIGRRCRLLRFDVSSQEQVAEVLQPLLEEEVPEVLVNNAGILADGAMAMMRYEDWKRVLEVNLDGFFLVTKPVIFGMVRRRRGRVINISSTSGQTGVPGQVNYSAAKAGLIGATRSLAVEVARRGILVNAVAPGVIETEMSEDTASERLMQAIPLKRTGTADEVAGAVVFLCSDEAAYVTGQVISCNGGLHT